MSLVGVSYRPPDLFLNIRLLPVRIKGFRSTAGQTGLSDRPYNCSYLLDRNSHLNSLIERKENQLGVVSSKVCQIEELSSLQKGSWPAANFLLYSHTGISEFRSLQGIGEEE